MKFGAATYGCSNTIALRVTDANHSSGSMTVEVWSDTEPTPEIVTLVETAPGSGKFDGTIDTTSSAPGADGLLSIGNDDVITARYIDEDDGAGNTDVEQIATASAAVQTLMLAANAQGYGAIWLTGSNARDAGVKAAFGLADKDEIVGFVYLGTPTGPVPDKARPDPDEYVSEWTGE